MLIGSNGHGKTSVLEALLYAEVFRSFRGARDREIVRFGEPGFHVAVETDSGGRTVSAGYDARTGEKRVTVNGTVVTRLADAIGAVRGVVLSPDDVRLVAGGARERRRYLDIVLSLAVGGYVDALGEYRRALRHRCRAGDDVADWEALLARSGARVAAARREWVERWAARFAEHCREIGEPHEVTLCHHTRETGSEGELAAALERTRERDLARGATSVGPHRDDLRLLLAGRELRTYGSGGQWRTAAMALRLVEAETVGDAVLCLDDAFAELDRARSARLGALVEGLSERGSQVVATVPKDGEMPAAVGRLPRWRIGDGKIEAL